MEKSDGQFTKNEMRTMILRGDTESNLFAWIQGELKYEYLYRSHERWSTSGPSY